MHDLIIIGGGPAGLTAAIYAARRNLKTLVITKDIGGQAAQTKEIENYPGFLHVDGTQLMQQFHDQAKQWGTEFVYQSADAVEKNTDDTFNVIVGNDSYQGIAVILAFGLEHRHLDVPGEKEFYGKGITYCATCDGPLFKAKDVCVIGGGNSALDAIIYMSSIAKSVKAIVRGPRFKGEEVLIEQAITKENVTVLYNTEVAEITGDKFVTGIVTKGGDHIPLQGVFVEIGYQPNTAFYGHLVQTTPAGAIIVDADCNTSLPGFFAAGDVTTLSYKQIITSGGEGCKAALTAYTYIQKKKGNDAKAGRDWTKK